MRILLAASLLLPAAVLVACQVNKDNANNTVSVTYNEEVASNAAADVGNTVENIAGDIGNDVKNESARVKNTDIDVNVNKNVQTNTTENKSK